MNTYVPEILATLTVLTFLSGCAFTKSVVKLNYKAQDYVNKADA